MLRSLVLTTSLLLPAPALAASVLDGTWKTDMSTAKFSGKPVVFSLNGGIYSCSSCVPPESFSADGKPHKVAHQPYHDTAMASVVSPTEIDLTLSKGGKVVTTQTMIVSSDGMTATFKGRDSSDSNSAPVDFSYIGKRVGKAPADAHALSGSWMPTSGGDSDNGLTTTYRIQGNLLSMSSPTGQSYTAKINGTEAPYIGDPGLNTVVIKQLGPNSFVETDYRDGKVINVTKTTVAADGKSAKIISDYTGQHMEATAFKQ